MGRNDMGRTLRKIAALAIIAALAVAAPVSAAVSGHHSHDPAPSAHEGGPGDPGMQEPGGHDRVQAHCGAFCVMAPAHGAGASQNPAPSEQWHGACAPALHSLCLELPTPPPRTA